jgi:hypothetical protein
LPTFRDNLSVPSFKGPEFWILDPCEDGTDRFFRNVGNKLPRRFVITQRAQFSSSTLLQNVNPHSETQITSSIDCCRA